MKKWSKPELTVLVRSRPEEAVLTGCKLETAEIGPGEGVATCHEWNEKFAVCKDNTCAEITTS